MAVQAGATGNVFVSNSPPAEGQLTLHLERMIFMHCARTRSAPRSLRPIVSSRVEDTALMLGQFGSAIPTKVVDTLFQKSLDD